jgi:hypothetical protein
MKADLYYISRQKGDDRAEMVWQMNRFKLESAGTPE